MTGPVPASDVVRPPANGGSRAFAVLWLGALVVYIGMAPLGARLDFLGLQYGAQPVLFLAVLTAAFLALVAQRRRVPMPLGIRLILVYMAWALITLTWTPDSSFGAYLWVYRLHIIVPCAWFAVALAIQPRVAVDVVIDVYIAVCVVAVALSFGGFGATSAVRLSLVEGYNPSWLGGYLSLAVLAAAWRSTRADFKPYRIAVLAGGAISLVGVVYTQTRNSLLSLLAGAVMAVGVHYLHAALDKHSARRVVLQALRGAVVVVLGAGAAWFAYRSIAEMSGMGFADLDRIERTLSGVDANTATAGRFEIWGRGVRFVHQPLWGVGFGSFPILYEAGFGRRAEAHNLYLQVLVETGVIGLALVLAFLGVVWRRIWAARASFVTVWTFWYLALLAFGNDVLSYKHFWVGWVFLIVFLSDEAEDAREAT